MPELNASDIVFLVSIFIYTAVTTWTDIRKRKIYNWTTVSMFAAGWVYQLGFFGLDGLWNGLIGFAIGFGLFFGLWMIGSAGGGDVKLMGGLSVWVGKSLILKVILASLMFVICGMFVVMIWSVLSKGWTKTKNDFSKTRKKPKNEDEALKLKAKRRVMAFAAPVALGTWSVLLLFFKQW